MSIKQSIAALLLLMSVSFSASAGYVRVLTSNHACMPVGAIYEYSYIQYSDYYVPGVCSGIDLGQGAVSEGVRFETPYSNKAFLYGGGRALQIGTYTTASGCEDGQLPNEFGLCEGEGNSPPFCSQASTQQQMRDFESSCFNDGGSPTIVCNDQVDPPDLRMTCEIEPPPPTGCVPDSPSFPACLDEPKCDENHPDWVPMAGKCCNESNNYCDEPPPKPCTIFSEDPSCLDDNDVIPPDSGDLGDPSFPDVGGSGGNGSGSTASDKPQPDVDNTSNELAAIKSMNDDLNSQLNAINNDMNKNQSETKSALDALKASTDLNTQSVIDGANHVANALDGQSDMLSQLGNKNNQLLSSINGLLNNGFGELANGLNGVGSGLDGLSATNQQGFGDVIEAIEGLGTPLVNPELGSPSKELYSGESYSVLQGEVDVLKAEYEDILNQYRTYFSFNQGVNSGQYDSHDIDLNWHGTAINKSNQVMASLRDNAGIISAVVLFIFGMMGIRAISGAF